MYLLSQLCTVIYLIPGYSATFMEVFGIWLITLHYPCHYCWWFIHPREKPFQCPSVQFIDLHSVLVNPTHRSSINHAIILLLKLSKKLYHIDCDFWFLSLIWSRCIVNFSLPFYVFISLSFNYSLKNGCQPFSLSFHHITQQNPKVIQNSTGILKVLFQTYGQVLSTANF